MGERYRHAQRYHDAQINLAPLLWFNGNFTGGIDPYEQLIKYCTETNNLLLLL